MFNFTCPQCSRRSLSVGRSQCFHCVSEAATINERVENLPQRQTNFETAGDNNVDGGSGNHLVPGDTQNRSNAQLKNNKKIQSNDRWIKESTESHRISTQETDSKRVEACSSDNKVGSGTHDSVPETSNSEVHSSFDNSLSKENSTINQNITSNISILKKSLNDNAPVNGAEACKIKSLGSVGKVADNFYAVPGPSGLQRKMSKLSEENVQSNKSAKTDFVATRDTKVYICRFCNEDISKHPHDGEKYKCCSCTYQTSERANLQMHSYDHRPENICSICEKEYIGDSHNKQHTCIKCQKPFWCRTRLREHYLYHGGPFPYLCWYCCNNIETDCNAANENHVYVCCFCGYTTEEEYGLIVHKRIHKPKLFCKICREEFNVEEDQFHGKESSCFLCEKEFKCKAQIEDHLVDHPEYLSTHCPSCRSELKKHRRKRDKKLWFECCECFEIIKARCYKDFTSHIFNHFKLRVFKCDSCGSRFSNNNTFSQHSRNCKSKPFRCEICRFGFDKKDPLNMHRSTVHN